MLSSSRVTTILPVVDAERAHDFYSRVLGLKDLGKTGDGNICSRRAAVLSRYFRSPNRPRQIIQLSALRWRTQAPQLSN